MREILHEFPSKGDDFGFDNCVLRHRLGFVTHDSGSRVTQIYRTSQTVSRIEYLTPSYNTALLVRYRRHVLITATTRVIHTFFSEEAYFFGPPCTSIQTRRDDVGWILNVLRALAARSVKAMRRNDSRSSSSIRKSNIMLPYRQKHQDSVAIVIIILMYRVAQM